jgi:nitronate monooxygenase
MQNALDAAKQIRALTSKPFAINLFAGGYDVRPPVDSAPMLALVSKAHAELGLPPPVLPPNPENPFADQLAAVIEARPALFSFTFGIPSADALARLRRAGIRTSGTATTAEEGRALRNSAPPFSSARNAAPQRPTNKRCSMRVTTRRSSPAPIPAARRGVCATSSST